jgi:hypothetical protein
MNMAASKDRTRKTAEKMAALALECMAGMSEAERKKNLTAFTRAVAKTGEVRGRASVAAPRHPTQRVAVTV